MSYPSIYELKKNHNQIKSNFVEVNCATLRGDQAMSTLFGHKKGSFTGAINDRSGLLKTADCGICFLDEIAELGLDEQAMLLRAIEEKKFLPLGSDKEDSSDFQLICGTNKNLKDKVTSGEFRDDLLARINLWTFSLPHLKDRIEDIEPNINYELLRYTDKTGRKISFNKEASSLFINFAMSDKAIWQSNFRDLNGAITRMATLSAGGIITKIEAREEIERLLKSWNSTVKNEFKFLNKVLSESEISKIDLYDRIQLEGILDICIKSKSLSEAGRKLYNVSRNNKQKTNNADRLRKYLARFNISWDVIQNN